MSVNSYQVLKEFLRGKLNKFEKPLPAGKIRNEIDNQKNTMSTIGNKIMATILSVEYLDNLSEEDWQRMARELEMHFDVKMDQGVIVRGEDQQKRDLTWWTRKSKIESKAYFWNRYKEFIGESLPYEVVKTIDEDTDVVMNNLADPNEKNFSRYGMVVGHVQSGKTANYSALVCKAADAGYKFIVVIAGGMNNLRDQTQERLNEAFIGNDLGKRVGVGNFGENRKDISPVSLTTKDKDFNKQDANRNAQSLNFDNITSPVILVIKKNTSTLKNVIEWLEAQYENGVSKHAMLLIDDESDYASINTKEEEDPTIINERIRKLLSLFRKSAYVAYTATPYANIFIDHKADNLNIGKDLFPEDFIYALEAPTNYFGAKKIFLDPERKCLVPVSDYQDILPRNHKKEHRIDYLPESLEDAIRLFILNIAIRHLRGQENKHNSMLVHITRFTDVHKDVAKNVSQYFDEVKKVINVYGSLKNPELKNDHIQNIKLTLEEHYSTLEFSWSNIISKITNIIGSIVIREVHTDTKIPLEYPKDSITNAIVIGGTSLSRGYTLEGLSVSYFLRNTVFYDTLMQMGRWFGYRTDYEDLCRIYMTSTMFSNFKTIIEATLDLVDSLEEMARKGMTPKDFGLAVQHHPDSGLQVTARNKLKNSNEIYFEMKLDGHLKETSWLSRDRVINENNINAIKKIIMKLGDTEKISSNDYLWRDIKREVVAEFLEEFTTYNLNTDEFGMRTRMPIKFVKEYVNKIDTNWDIVIYSGSSDKIFEVGDVKINKQLRKVDLYQDYYEVRNRQVSSGNAEGVSLTEKQKKILKELSKQGKNKEKSSRRKVSRALLEKPLLMLHILDANIWEEVNKTKVKCGNESITLAAFGISFPGGIVSGNKNIRLKVNSVYIDQVLSGEDNDD